VLCVVCVCGWVGMWGDLRPSDPQTMLRLVALVLRASKNITPV
jgi:hypothetical protein